MEEAKVAAQISIQFKGNGDIGWKAEGDVPLGPAVNILEIIKLHYLQTQLMQAAAAQMNQKQIALPNGPLPKLR